MDISPAYLAMVSQIADRIGLNPALRMFSHLTMRMFSHLTVRMFSHLTVRMFSHLTVRYVFRP